MGKQDVHLVAILDRSGSMSNLIAEMRSGFNSLKAQQLLEDGETYVTVTVFDSQIDRLYTGVNVKSAPDLTSFNYYSRGSTSLLDAIGQTVADVAARKDLPKKVMLVIATDGHENSSREYTKAAIQKLISKYQNRKTNPWNVVFMGAGVDAFDTAQFGFSSNNSTINVTRDYRGTQAFYGAVGQSIGSYRHTGQTTNSLDISGASNVDYGNNPTLDKNASNVSGGSLDKTASNESGGSITKNASNDSGGSLSKSQAKRIAIQKALRGVTTP